MDERFEVDGAELSCPSCGRTFAARVHILADAGQEPRWRRPGEIEQLNRVTCPACGQAHLAQVPLLVVDPGRALAVAYVPPALADDATDLVTGLLRRRMRLGLGDGLEDWLLEPALATSAEHLALLWAGRPRAIAGVAAGSHPGLREALAWARRGRRELVLTALEALAPVTDEEQLLEVLNDQPLLLEPAMLAALEEAGAVAERELLPAVAELLHDVGALLAMQHLEEPDSDLGLQPGQLPAVVEELLGHADLEAASEFLEPPDERRRQDALRAALELDVEEQREGTHQHAVLFGELLEEMLQEVSPEDVEAPPAVPPVRTHPDEVPLEAVLALLAADTLDQAQEVIEAWPELATEAGLATLQRLTREAAAVGDESRASHIETLLGVVLVSIDDDEAEP